MNYENLRQRTKRFALDIIKLTEQLPRDQTCRVLGGQLLRCGTSVGANYRAVCRAKSNADFISKFGTVEEEADESAYWLELLVDSGKLKLKPAALCFRKPTNSRPSPSPPSTPRALESGEGGVRNSESLTTAPNWVVGSECLIPRLW